VKFAPYFSAGRQDMLFKRRVQLGLLERLRGAIWPTRSFKRSLRYMMLRLLRIPASSHSIAVGCAAGVFAIFTPFLGFQMMLAAVLAIALRGSVLASAIGTFAGNPLTYSVIWFSTLKLGNILLGSSANAETYNFSDNARALGRSIKAVSLDGISSAIQGLWPVLKPMALGSLPLGGLAALAVYYSVKRFLDGQEEKRMARAGLRAIAEV